MKLYRLLESAAFALILAGWVATLLVSAGTVPAGLVALRLLVGAGVAVYGLAVAARGSLVLPTLALAAPVGLYLVAVVLSAGKSSYAFGSAEDALNRFLYAGTFLAAFDLLADRSRRQVLLAVLGGTVLALGAYGVAQAFGLGFTPRASEGPVRISSMYYHQTHYGGLLTLLVPFLAGLALFTRGLVTRTVWALLAALAGLNLGLTLSWDAFPPVALALLVLGLAWAGAGWLRLAVVVATAAALAAASAYAVFELGPKVLPSSYLSSPQALWGFLVEHWDERLGIYQGALRVVEENPALGVGPGNFIYAWTRYRPESAEPHPALHAFVNYAHHDYLQVATETGLLGLAGFVAFWLALLSARSAQGPAIGLGVRLGLLALLLHGLTDANLTVVPGNALTAWLLAGLLAAPAGPPDG